MQRWEIFELSFAGKKEGNPYIDYEIKGIFESDKEKKEVEGFYDGDGVYKIRFMPSVVGKYHYSVSGNFSD